MNDRDVILQVSADRQRPRFVSEVLQVLQTFSDETKLPASLVVGTSLFPGLEAETMVRITIHGLVDPAIPVGLWRWLRGTINGIDCGRIELDGLSWCAKAYANHLDRENGMRIRYANNDYPPTRVG